MLDLFRIFSRNRFSRVLLSVKRTVPPQLSATASLPLSVATVGVSPSTAVPGERDEESGFPRRFAPRNDNTRGLLLSAVANHPDIPVIPNQSPMSLAWQSVLPAPQSRHPFLRIASGGVLLSPATKVPKNAA